LANGQQTFFGPLASGGWFALYRYDLRGVLMGKTAGGTVFLEKYSFQADGSFRVTASGATGSGTAARVAAAVVPLTFSGRIDGDNLTAQVETTGESFGARADAATGSTAGSAGYYEAPGLDSVGRIVALLVGNTGTLRAIATFEGSSEAGEGIISEDGRWSATLSSGGRLSGSIVGGTLTGLLQPTAGAGWSFMGVEEALPRTDRLVNLSTRGPAGDSDKTIIAGFVLAGTEPKAVLIRAVGPTLATLGVDGVMENPSLTLYRDGAAIARNDDWGGAPGASEIAAAAARLGAFPLPPTSYDAAILRTLAPGPYTAQVTRTDGSSNGIVLVEVYDVSANPGGESQKLINLSSRGEVRTGNGILIGGFVVTGNAPKKVLVRGVGPSLVKLGFAPANVLANPQIKLFQGATVIASNDDWGSGDSAALVAPSGVAVGAFALDANSKDAALVLTLAPGVYTAQVSGADGGTGIALLEIYEVP
jgi:hypothetical protein